MRLVKRFLMKTANCLMLFGVAVSLILGVGCKKKEKAAEEALPPGHAPIIVKKEDVRVTVPDAVKGRWNDIKIEVTDKGTNQKNTVTVPVGGEVAIPASNLKIRAETFLPAFMMDGADITSTSNEPKNPAAQIIVTEGGKEIFKGWLFTLYPPTHPFEHPKYGLTFVGYTQAP